MLFHQSDIVSVGFDIFNHFNMAELTFDWHYWKEFDPERFYLKTRKFQSIPGEVNSHFILTLFLKRNDSASDWISSAKRWPVSTAINYLIWNIIQRRVCISILQQLLRVLFGSLDELLQADIFRQIMKNLTVVAVIADAQRLIPRYDAFVLCWVENRRRRIESPLDVLLEHEK